MIQGAAAGVVSPQILGVIQDLLSGKTGAKALGIYGIIVGLSTALGPVIGGLLLTIAGTAESWRLVFLIDCCPAVLGKVLSSGWWGRTPGSTVLQELLVCFRRHRILLLLCGFHAIFLIMTLYLQQGLSKEVLLVDAHSHALAISALCIIAILVLALAANLIDVVRRKDRMQGH